MRELARFQRRLNHCQSVAFNFERASVALLCRLRQNHHQDVTVPVSPTLGSEWRDPARYRLVHRPHEGAQHA